MACNLLDISISILYLGTDYILTTSIVTPMQMINNNTFSIEDKMVPGNYGYNVGRASSIGVLVIRAPLPNEIAVVSAAESDLRILTHDSSPRSFRGSERQVQDQ